VAKKRGWDCETPTPQVQELVAAIRRLPEKLREEGERSNKTTPVAVEEDNGLFNR
jgi:hypothetical protein